MQDTNFYARLYHFTALKHTIHHFTAAKQCSANTAARRSASKAARKSGEATARAIQRGALIRVDKLEAGSRDFTRVGKLAAAKYLCG